MVTLCALSVVSSKPSQGALESQRRDNQPYRTAFPLLPHFRSSCLVQTGAKLV